MDMVAQLREFRRWAHLTSPEFGQRVDMLILDGQGLGANISITESLERLTRGIADAANAASLSLEQYYDAKTRIDNMRRANQAGLTVSQYTAAATPGLVTGVAASTGQNAITGALPTWLLIGGVATALILLARR